MMRILTILFSAIVAAGLFIVARDQASHLLGGDVVTASASIFAAPVPVIAAALAFPALYLLWEQSEL
jgi:hypothetical protein